MPTADYRSSWINEQCCGSAKTSEFVSWHSELVFEVLYCSQLVSVFLSISQVLYYAEKSIFPSTHLESCITRRCGVGCSSYAACCVLLTSISYIFVHSCSPHWVDLATLASCTPSSQSSPSPPPHSCTDDCHVKVLFAGVNYPLNSNLSWKRTYV